MADGSSWGVPSDRGAATASDRGRSTRDVLQKASRKAATPKRAKSRSLSSASVKAEELKKQLARAVEQSKQSSDAAHRAELHCRQEREIL